MAEVPQPRVVRRLVAFAEAVYEGCATVEGVSGRLYEPADLSFLAGEVGVVVDPTGSRLAQLAPAAVVDARMTKRTPETLPVGERPVIGLGPGFHCGRDADFVIETHRGARLGAVLTRGEALPNTGVPGPVGGESVRRLLRSPAAGKLTPICRLGDLVTSGETVAMVGTEPVVSQLDGLLRGLVHPEVELLPGDKVGDVDPRGAAVDPSLVSDKALAVAGGVLEALLRLGQYPA
jgi:xanthine dehydrogenase accessory factor